MTIKNLGGTERMMKHVHAVAFGIGAFFAMNCGSGEGGYPESTGGGGSAVEGRQPTQSTDGTDKDDELNAGPNAGSIAVNGHTFDPPEVHIKAGESVKWTWVSGSHNVVSGAACTPDGKFTSGSSTIGPGSTFSHTFDTAGTYPYYCDPHCGIGMVGKVIVE
jgi:plastocyanin